MRLSKENSSLRMENQNLNALILKEENEKYDKIISLLKTTKIKISFAYLKSNDWENHKDVSLFELFKLLAAEFMFEK